MGIDRDNESFLPEDDPENTNFIQFARDCAAGFDHQLPKEVLKVLHRESYVPEREDYSD